MRNSNKLFGCLKQQGTRIHQFLPIIGFQDQTNYCQSCLTSISVLLALIRSRILAVVHIEPCKPLNTLFIHFKATTTLEIKHSEPAMLNSCKIARELETSPHESGASGAPSSQFPRDLTGPQNLEISKS